MFHSFIHFRQVIILDPVLIKAGTKQMCEMSKKMEKNMAALERHNTLLQYYAESSCARLKAVWCVNSTLMFFKEYFNNFCFNLTLVLQQLRYEFV